MTGLLALAPLVKPNDAVTQVLAACAAGCFILAVVFLVTPKQWPRLAAKLPPVLMAVGLTLLAFGRLFAG